MVKKKQQNLLKGANVNVQTFTVAPSTFMAINTSPKKGSLSSTSFDPEHLSFKQAQPVMIEEVYPGDNDDETDRKKGKREQTFKEGVSKTMDQFHPKFPMIMDYLLASESNPTIGLPCSCGEGIHGIGQRFGMVTSLSIKISQNSAMLLPLDMITMRDCIVIMVL
ncbi:hypothetical protein IW262DRAFT_1302758 [Armillaria fumosa]|nr:hypothetical protein IW262DRAFT_1302758 [Armillaria fumosa]